MGNKGVKALAKILVGKSYRENNIENSNEPLAVRQRRKYRAQGGSVDMFKPVHGRVVNDGIVFDESQMVRFERAYSKLAGVGRDGEFAEQNAHQQASAHERRRQERERVDRAIEQREQGTVEDAEPEDQEFFEAEESTPVKERRHSRPVGLEAVNQEYARRKGVNIARVS